MNRILYLLCAVGAFGLAGYTYMQLAATDKLFAQGPVKTAQVEPASTQYTETRGKFGIKSYKTSLGFTAENGQRVVVRDAYISKEELDKFLAGETITREYLVADPQTTREQGKNEPKWPAWLMAGIGVVLLLSGLGSGKSDEEEAEPEQSEPPKNNA